VPNFAGFPGFCSNSQPLDLPCNQTRRYIIRSIQSQKGIPDRVTSQMGMMCQRWSTSPLNLPLKVIIMYLSSSPLVSIQNVSKPS
jgi:hypothetical protein